MSRSAPKPELPSVVHAAKYPQAATDPPFHFAPTPTLGPMPELIPPLHQKPELPSVLMAKKYHPKSQTLDTHRRPSDTGFFIFIGFLGFLIIIWLYYYLRYHPGENDPTFW